MKAFDIAAIAAVAYVAWQVKQSTGAAAPAGSAGAGVSAGTGTPAGTSTSTAPTTRFWMPPLGAQIRAAVIERGGASGGTASGHLFSGFNFMRQPIGQPPGSDSPALEQPSKM